MTSFQRSVSARDWPLDMVLRWIEIAVPPDRLEAVRTRTENLDVHDGWRSAPEPQG